MLDKLNNTLECLSDVENEKWVVEVSSNAKNCRNFIREIVDNLDLKPNPEKPVIALSIGDPTIYGNLPPSDETVKAILDVATQNAFNGYVPSVGTQSARAAVAEYLSFDGMEINHQDVILCSGCSSALEHCITVLVDPLKNQNVLIPRPGFPLYRTLAESIGAQVKYYNLLPESNWEIDLDHLESQIDQNTACIIVNNPSNPCGSVYTETHLKQIMEIAYNKKLPIIADEIYERLVFPGEKFVSMATLDSDVPMLVCGGIAKRFLIPGWRLGWIVIKDNKFNTFKHVKKGLISLSQRIMGCNTVMQAALPDILKNTPQSFHENLINFLHNNAMVAYEELSKVKGLSVFKPQGAMYMVVEICTDKFPMFKDGLEFAQQLMVEESVFCLPGECFAFPGFMRIVITVPEDLLREACLRIQEFCNRYYTDAHLSPIQ